MTPRMDLHRLAHAYRPHDDDVVVVIDEPQRAELLEQALVAGHVGGPVPLVEGEPRSQAGLLGTEDVPLLRSALDLVGEPGQETTTEPPSLTPGHEDAAGAV